MENNKGKIQKIKVSEVFPSIQGEGRYAGYPMLFIRTSGCNRACSWCDTTYHNQGRFFSIADLIKRINKTKLEYICFTGGEPLLWREQIYEVIKKTLTKKHHLETNGDFLIKEDLKRFDYLAISPKDFTMATEITALLSKFEKPSNYDIKIVTDLETTGKELIPFATFLMPLTIYKPKKDLEIQQKVWNYCIKNNLKFCPRLQYFVWGKKKKI